LTDFLNSDVSVANDLAALEFLGCAIVGNVRVCEGASDEVEDLDVNCEVGVSFEVVTRAGVGDDGRDHVGVGGDITHNYE